MRIFWLILFLCGQQPLFAQTWPTPFSIRLEEATWPEWPGMHSFAHGVHDGRWFMLYGRQEGMHGMIPPDPFPVDKANLSVHMLDPESGEHWEQDIFSLPDSIAFPLRSTNPEFVQRGDYLYIMGGYGKDTTSEDFLTFATMVVVDLPALQTALETGNDMTPAFRLYRDSLFYLCGGEAEWLGDRVVLFGGHEFTGEYTMIGGIGFTQRYTNEVRSFKLEDDGTDLTITDVQVSYDSILFHRRDLNLAPVIFPGGEEGLAAYAGVFQYDGNFPWLTNLYFDGDAWTEDTATQQQFNHYTCPVLSLYDSSAADMYTIFFGGISQFYLDTIDSVIMEDLNIPFVSDITCLTRQADGTALQEILPIRFPEMWGSNAVFIPSDSMGRFPNEVLDLQSVDGEVLAGYLFGGIAPEFPNLGPSAASNKLYKVYLQYDQPEPVTVSGETFDLQIFPNPAAEYLQVSWQNNHVVRVSWTDLNGRTVLEQMIHSVDGQLRIPTPENGWYVLELTDGRLHRAEKVAVLR